MLVPGVNGTPVTATPVPTEDFGAYGMPGTPTAVPTLPPCASPGFRTVHRWRPRPPDSLRRTAPPGPLLVRVGAGLRNPVSVVLDQSGDVFIADQGNQRVVKVSPDGHQITIPIHALGYPAQIAYGVDGSLYVADTFNNEIVRIGPTGRQTTPGKALHFPSG